MNLLDLMVKVSVDDKASKGIDSVSTSIKGKLASAAKVGAAAVAAVGAAGTAAAVKLVDVAKDVAEYGDNIDKMSQKMGLSAEAYQEWDAVMQHSGTSMEAMKASMKTLANAAENGNEAFQRLGLTQEQVASMSQEELFEATIAGLQGVEDTTERTYLAGQLLGRGATELGALLNTSAEDTQKMRDRVHELGGVMSDEAVKASAAFQDSLQDLNTGITGIKNAFIGELLPGMTGVMDGIQEILVGNVDEGIEMVADGIESVITAIGEKGPALLERFAAIGQALFEGIGRYFDEHGPEIAAAASTFLGNALQSLIDFVPVFMEGVGQLLGEVIATFPIWGPELLKATVLLFAYVIQGILEITAGILNGVAALLESIIQSVTGYNGSLLEAAQNLFHNIGDAVTNTREFIVTSVQEAINAAITAVTEFFQQAFDVGANIVQGIVQGIQSAPQAVADALGGVVGGAVDGVKGFLGIASPSTLFAEIGNFTMEGFANGISGGGPSVLQSMQNIMQGLVDGTGVGRDDVVNVMSALPQMMTAALGPAGWMLGDIGRYMMQGLANGISSSQNWVVDALWGGVWGAVDMVKGWLGIQSPSKLFAELGGYTMQGFAKGIDAEADTPEKAMLDAAQAVYGAASGKIDFAAAASAAGIKGGYPIGGVSIVINDPVIRETADVDAIMNHIELRVQRRMQQWNQSYSMA